MKRILAALVAWTLLVAIGFFLVVPVDDPSVEYWLLEALWYAGLVWLAGPIVIGLAWVWREHRRGRPFL